MNKIIPIFFVASLLSCSPVNEVREYISSSWDSTVRYNPEDDGTLLGLPCRYTVPCPEGTFQEMYYWDTFFTNEGLIKDGRVDLAIGNVENVMFLVGKYGFMPNGSRTWYLNRSQPPYLAWMVESVFEATQDTVWLAKAYDVIEKEYAFWTSERTTPVGLSAYSSAADDALAEEFVNTASQRLGYDFIAECATKEELLRMGRHFAAEAESGWDFNPRFLRRCEEFCPVDLNANLYHYEKLMERFSEVLNTGDECKWAERAEQRKHRILTLMRGEDGMFYDYDFVNGERSTVVSAAVFNLLAAGVLEVEEAQNMIGLALKELECCHGLAMCGDQDYGHNYQWSYPYGWAPGAYMAVRGLDEYGYSKDAKRLAEKYVNSICRIYQRTGTLWEKYNVNDIFENADAEYETPPMLGWSAGVFVYFVDYLEDLK